MSRGTEKSGEDRPDRDAAVLSRSGVESPGEFACARDRFVLVGPPGGACDRFAPLLKALGTVDVYPEISSALAGLHATCPEMILSNVVLPEGQDVFEFLRAVRAHPRARTVPVILCSAQEGDDAVALGLDGGANDYFGPAMSDREAEARLRSHLRLARALHEEQERLQSTADDLTDFFEHVGIAMQWVGPDGRILRANRAELDLLGYRPEEYVGRHIADFHVDHAVIDDMLRRLADHETLNDFEARLRSKQGEVKHVLISSNVKWEAGRFVHTRCLTRDVTDRRRAEAALHDAEEMLRVVVAHSPMAVFALDREGVFTLVEGRALQVMGLASTDLIGRPIFDVYRRSPWIVSAVRQVLDGELSIRNGAVGSMWLEMYHAPLRDEDQHVIGVIGVAVDVTGQKRIEEEVVRASRLESIGVLAGGIAHDFNNILMAIVGNLSLAKLLVDPHGKIFQRIDESQRAAMRARSLTQQLLAFSKGGLPVRKPIALEALVQESAQFALRGSNVDCEVSFPEPLWPVDADEGQVGQVIANLALNAQQAMPDGGSICVAGSNVTLDPDDVPPLGPGDYVLISVTDRGVGIPPDVVEKIFDPFFTTKANGSGLGLTTSYWIARRHDGHITVKSSAGSGATVSLYLPRSESSGAGDSSKGSKADRATTRRILVMDDDELVRDVVSGMLKGLGCDAECSADGQEAVACFSRARTNGRPFDAVILDLTVRDGMGGMEALERLKAIEPEVKAIVASGYSNAPIMFDSEVSGFCMSLAKPFSIEQLEQALARVIGTSADSSTLSELEN